MVQTDCKVEWYYTPGDTDATCLSRCRECGCVADMEMLWWGPYDSIEEVRQRWDAVEARVREWMQAHDGLCTLCAAVLE